MVLLSMQDIPHTGVKEGGWWFYHGGDEKIYFNVAKSIADLNLIAEPPYFPIGFSLFLAPFIYFAGATQITDILKPVFIIHAFLLFPF